MLNIMVERIAAHPRAVAAMQNYETTGLLTQPLVTLHTWGDSTVPYRHDWWYRRKVEATRSTESHTQIPVYRAGHCSFTVGEALFGFGLMLLHSARRPIQQAAPLPMLVPQSVPAAISGSR